MLPGLIAAARADLADLLASDAAPEQQTGQSGHRRLMAAVGACVVVPLAEGTDPGPDVVAAAQRWLTRLTQLQAPSGLFSSSVNLESPPDSAFTINDVTTTLALLRGPAREAWGDDDDDVPARLTALLRRALPALIAGGVHTPNHRWELASALAAAGRLLGQDAALARARDWLGEGIDVDSDGLYSERSPNYAAYVSDPSLLVLADTLPSDALRAIVHRNLHATLDLATPAGSTEALYSRRQDQRELGFPLGPFLGPFARFAAGCDRCARGAHLASLTADVSAASVLALAALHTEVAEGLDRAAATSPVLTPDHGERIFPVAGLWRRWRGPDWTVVYGGSDVPATGRVASGLATNPTFARFARAGVEVASLRLSRGFFDVGPFRAATIEAPADTPDDAPAGALPDGETPGGGAAPVRRLRLIETLRASYYQPLAAADRRADGRYPLEDEGRFSAALGFSARDSDEHELRTTVTITDAPNEVVVEIETAGVATWQSLEIALAPGVAVTGAVELDGDRFRLVESARVRRPGAAGALELAADPPGSVTLPAAYDPGERYTHLGGTDALGGIRLYAAWRSPGLQRIAIRVTD